MTWIWYTQEEKCIGLQSYVDYKGLKCVEICVTFANKTHCYNFLLILEVFF
jgi:hypothetical protein